MKVVAAVRLCRTHHMRFVEGANPSTGANGRAREARPSGLPRGRCAAPFAKSPPLRPRRLRAEDARGDRPPARSHPRASAPGRGRIAPAAVEGPGDGAPLISPEVQALRA